MLPIHSVALAYLLSALALACAGGASIPSDGAKSIPGAEGTIEFRPNDWLEGETTWWVDSDGVAPGVPGCHIGADEDGAPNGRVFGEACLPNGLLVESNPAANELHSHHNDTGHPDTFDCAKWCIAEGATGGICSTASSPPCDRSAFCSCDPQ
jgi:hypothetical protein